MKFKYKFQKKKRKYNEIISNEELFKLSPILYKKNKNRK